MSLGSSRVLVLALVVYLAQGCNNTQPVATKLIEKYSEKSGDAEKPKAGKASDGGGSPDVNQAELIEKGSEAYAQVCSDCHGALASSAKKGASEARINASETIGSHEEVEWPSADEIKAIAAALTQ